MILYADDDPGWRELMSVWLAGKGLQSRVCASGAEALALVEELKPDCVILDYDIGDMKGSQACAKLKARPEFSHIPVIIMTNLAEEMLKAVKEGGPDHFVIKSEFPDELFLVLEGMLG